MTSNLWTFAQIIDGIRQSTNNDLSTEQIGAVLEIIKRLKFPNCEPYSTEQALEIIQIFTGVKSLPPEGQPNQPESSNFFPLLEGAASQESRRLLQQMAIEGEELQLAIAQRWHHEVIERMKKMIYTNQLETMATQIRTKVLSMEEQGLVDGAKLFRELHGELYALLTRSQIEK